MKRIMSELIDYAEENFDCQFGPTRAYFELPQVSGHAIRVVYVVYCASSPAQSSTNKWMLDNVLKPLKVAGGEYLYWREPQQIREYEVDGRFYTYARIAVLDASFNPVLINEMVKPEGAPVIRIDKGEDDEPVRDGTEG